MHNSVIVYLDDITIFSKRRHDHLFSLRQVFERCRKYGISLNPKKSVFAATEGKILGFFVSKDGKIIDPKRIEAIAKTGLPRSKKAMEYFLGKINFARRFVPNFAQIVRPLQDMIKKDVLFRWFDIQKDAFSNMNNAIMDVPALMLPYFSKYFILYTFSTDFSYVAMLTQKNAEDVEIPISFMSSTFEGAELNYTQVDK